MTRQEYDEKLLALIDQIQAFTSIEVNARERIATMLIELNEQLKRNREFEEYHHRR